MTRCPDACIRASLLVAPDTPRSESPVSQSRVSKDKQPVLHLRPNETVTPTHVIRSPDEASRHRRGRGDRGQIRGWGIDGQLKVEHRMAERTVAKVG